MADTASNFIWQRLQARGVRRVYGYPGDGIGIEMLEDPLSLGSWLTS